jgi:hypothetical protein
MILIPGFTNIYLFLIKQGRYKQWYLTLFYLFAQTNLMLKLTEVAIELYSLNKVAKDDYNTCTRRYMSVSRTNAAIFVCSVTMRLFVGGVEAAQMTELWFKVKSLRTVSEEDNLNSSTRILNVFLAIYCLLCFVPSPYFLIKGDAIFREFE